MQLFVACSTEKQAMKSWCKSGDEGTFLVLYCHFVKVLSWRIAIILFIHFEIALISSAYNIYILSLRLQWQQNFEHAL